MAEEKTLAALTVRIGANIEAFSSGLAKAEKRLAKMEKNFKQVGESISKNISLPLAAMGGYSFKAFSDSETALAKLTTQLRSNGKDVKTLLPDYDKFATEMQRLTRVEDDAAMGLLQLAESMGSSNAKQATKDAIGLSKALGIDMESAVKIAVQAQNGQYTMLQRYAPAIRAATSDTEKAALAQKLFADGFKIAQAEAQSGLGPLIQMKNSLDDLAEDFGKIIAEGLNPFILKIKGIVEAFKDLPQNVKENIVTYGAIAAAIGPLIFGISKLIGAVKGVVSAFKVMSAFLAANPFTIWVVAIGAVISVLVTLWNKFPGFRAAVKYTAESVSVFFQRAWITIKEGAELMWLAIKTYFTAIPKAAAAIWAVVKRAMKGENIGNAIQEEFGKIITDVTDSAKEIKSKYSEELSKIKAPNFKEILAAEKAKGAAKEAGEDVAEAFNVGFSDVIEGGGADNKTGSVKRDDTPVTSMTSKGVSGVSGNGLGLAKVVELETEKLKANAEKLKEVAITMKNEVGKVFVDLGDIIKNSLTDALSTFGESIGALATGSIGMKDFFSSLLDVVTGFLESLGQSLIAAGVGALAFKKLLLTPWAAIGAGVALVALAGVVKGLLSSGPGGSGGSGGSGVGETDYTVTGVPALASGGIATRPTLAMVGEYSNASTDPEVISPLSKLRDMMGTVIVSGTLKARGSELVAVIENETKRKNNLK